MVGLGPQGRIAVPCIEAIGCCNHAVTAPSALAMHADVCILSAARTPMGAFLGSLSRFSATDLGGIAIKGVH
jgi:hypothetical protein